MDDLKILTSFMYPHEAHMAKSFLESNGLEIHLKDELTVQVNNFYSNAVGGVKLMVKESDYNQGIQILKDGGFLNEPNTSNIPKNEIILMDSHTDKTSCPFCKSDNISSKNRKLNFLIIPLYFLLGMIFPIYRSNYKCFECNKEWRYRKGKVHS